MVSISGTTMPTDESGAGLGSRGRRATLFLLWTAFYSVLGIVLIARYDYHDGDGLARTANASYVLFSRYPHLAADGFVWNPLPSYVQLPFLGLRSIWPEVQTQGYAGVFMSALFMAGSVMQVRGFLLDRGVSRVWAVGITLGFALHPMMVLYGANGMSEAPYIYFVVVAVRRLTRWLHTDSIADLLVAALALGLGFLARYEIVAISAGTAVMVAGVTYWRTAVSAGRRFRVYSAMVDATIVSLPFVVSFVGWAFSGYVITGAAFAQFSSQYGNSSQVAGNAGFNTATGLVPAVATAVDDMLSVQVALPALLLLCLYLGIRRQDADFLPAYCLLGAGVAFVALTYVKGSILENMRYYSLVVPLASLAAGLIAPRGGWRPTATGGRWLDRWRRRSAWLGGSAVALGSMVAPLPIAFVRMQSQTADLSDYGIRSVFQPHKYPPAEDAQILQAQQGRTIAKYLDSLDPGRSSIVMDSYLGFPILVSSVHSKQFVITSDYDFTPLMNDPQRFGIKYYMVPEPTSSGLLDAVNRRYPTMWTDGAGISTLSVEFLSTVPGVPSWRLYKAIHR